MQRRARRARSPWTGPFGPGEPVEPGSAEAIPVATLVTQHADEIVRQWRDWRVSRSVSQNSEMDALLGGFLNTFVSMIPIVLGPEREEAERIWADAAELYGSVGAVRGLAAGEVVEEFQWLREALIRVLYGELVGAELRRLALRELLDLNRLVDRGVTQAAVGYTDALFFSWLRGTGVPEAPTPETLDEIRSQLANLRHELDALRERGGRR